MAGIKISALPAIPSSALTDIAPFVQGGVTYKATLLQVATLFGFTSGLLGLSAGGTNANLTASNGGIFYSTATAGAILSGTATAGLALLSGSTAAPTWSATAPLLTGGGTMAGNIAMGTHSITGMADPVNPQDAATKNYVDTIAAGGGAPVVCATTGALTVTQAGAGVGATLTNAGAQATLLLDGINPTVGQRVLVKNQSGGANTENGVYLVTNVGSGITNWVLTRALDYDTPSDINNTGVIPVESGTVNANTGWINTTIMVTVDTTAVTFVQFGVSFPVSLANGGTSANLTASNGGIFYSTGSAGAILAGTATAGQLLLSGSSSAPAWSTTTYPSTNAINTIMYASSANVLGVITPANSSVLISSAGGVPSWSTTLPSGLAATNLTLTTPALGTPSAGSLGSCSGYTVANLADVAWTDFSGTIGFTGFSANPTVTARYKLIGKTCFFEIVTGSPGTSNATGFTITGMPATSANTATQWFLPQRCQNGGAEIFTTVQAYMLANGTVITGRVAGNDAGWAATLGKYMNIIGFYETT